MLGARPLRRAKGHEGILHRTNARAQAAATLATRDRLEGPASKAAAPRAFARPNPSLTPQEIGSASYEVHRAAARFIRVVREASREVGFVAESAEPLFDAFRLRAAKALGSPDVNKATVRSLAAVNDPADILAAIFIQKSCVDVPGFNERTEAAGRAFIEAVSKADPMVVAWIAAAVAQVKPLPSR